MKRYVSEYATDVKLKMIQLLNSKVLSKERFLEMSSRIDKEVDLCKREMVTTHEAVKGIARIYDSLH